MILNHSVLQKSEVPLGLQGMLQIYFFKKKSTMNLTNGDKLIFYEDYVLKIWEMILSQNNLKLLFFFLSYRSAFSGPSSKWRSNSRNGTADSALGWSFLDKHASLPQLSEQSGSTAAVDDSCILFDFFYFPFSSQNLR
jgi:hypothetical protein